MADPERDAAACVACAGARREWHKRSGGRRSTALPLIAVALMAGFGLLAPAYGQAADLDFAAKASNLVAPYVESGLFSGSVIVAQEGRPLFRRAYGLANREWTIPNTIETRFRIGSITKQFTAAAILRLCEQGRLGLDDAATRYVPDLPTAWSRVTIRMLLNHASGIPNFTALPDYASTIARIARAPRAIVALLERETPLFPPGTGHEYSNTGYVLLAVVIERVTGKSAARYLGDAVLAPLGLRDIGDGDGGPILPSRASGYAHGHGAWRNAPPLADGVAAGAGDLAASAEDLVAWDRALFSDRVISSASLAAMFTDYGYGYGLGWYLGTAYGQRLWSHGGGIDGFAAIKDSYPDAGLTIAVLSNADTAPVQTMSRALAALYFGTSATEEVEIAARVLARYVGSYRLGPRSILRVSQTDGRLFTRIGGEARMPLKPESDRAFVVDGTGVRVLFDIEPDGRATGVTLHRNGTDRAGPKIEVPAIHPLTTRLMPRNEIVPGR